MGAALGVDVTAGTVRVVSVAAGYIVNQQYKQQEPPQQRHLQRQRRILQGEQQRQQQQRWQRQREYDLDRTASSARATAPGTPHAPEGATPSAGAPAAQSCGSDPRATGAATAEQGEDKKDGAAARSPDSRIVLTRPTSADSAVAPADGPSMTAERVARGRAALSQAAPAAASEATCANGAATAAGRTTSAHRACTSASAETEAEAARGGSPTARAAPSAKTRPAAVAAAAPRKRRQREGVLGRSQQERQYLFVQQVHQHVEHVEIRRLAHAVACCSGARVLGGDGGDRCCCCGKQRRQRVIYFLLLDWKDVEGVVKLGLPYLEIGCHLAVTGSGCFELQALMQRLLLLYVENLSFFPTLAAELFGSSPAADGAAVGATLPVDAADSCRCSYCARAMRPSVFSENFAPCPCVSSLSSSSSSFPAAAASLPWSSSLPAASRPATNAWPAQSFPPSPSRVSTASAAVAAPSAPASSAALSPAGLSSTALSPAAPPSPFSPDRGLVASFECAVSCPSATAETASPTEPSGPAVSLPSCRIVASSVKSSCAAALLSGASSVPPPAAAVALPTLSHVGDDRVSPRQRAAALSPFTSSSPVAAAAAPAATVCRAPAVAAAASSSGVAASPAVLSDCGDRALGGPAPPWEAVVAPCPNGEAAAFTSATNPAAPAAAHIATARAAAGRGAAAGTSAATRARRARLPAADAANAPATSPRKASPAVAGTAGPSSAQKKTGATAALTAARLWRAVAADVRRRQVAHLVISFSRESVCIIEALDFLMHNFPTTIFRYEGTCQAMNEAPTAQKKAGDFYECSLTPEERRDFYPYLLVNLKAGVSVHKVFAASSPRAAPAGFPAATTAASPAAEAAGSGTGETAAPPPAGHGCISQRIGGSTIGGATFMGLCRLLLADEEASPRELLQLAVNGDSRVCDMLVRDIYGGGYDAIGLKPSTIASTFGKLQHLPLRLLREYAIPEAKERATATKQAFQERFFVSVRSERTTSNTATTAVPSDAAAAAVGTTVAAGATRAPPDFAAARAARGPEEPQKTSGLPATGGGGGGLPTAHLAPAAGRPPGISTAAATAPTEANRFASDVADEAGLAVLSVAEEDMSLRNEVTRCHSCSRDVRVIGGQQDTCGSSALTKPLPLDFAVGSKCQQSRKEGFRMEAFIDNNRRTTGAAASVCLSCSRHSMRCCQEGTTDGGSREGGSTCSGRSAARAATVEGQREDEFFSPAATTTLAEKAVGGGHRQYSCCCCCSCCRCCTWRCSCCHGCHRDHCSDGCCRWRRRMRRSSLVASGGEQDLCCRRWRSSALFKGSAEQNDCPNCAAAAGALETEQHTGGEEHWQTHVSHRGACVQQHQHAAALPHSGGSTTSSRKFSHSLRIEVPRGAQQVSHNASGSSNSSTADEPHHGDAVCGSSPCCANIHQESACANVSNSATGSSRSCSFHSGGSRLESSWRPSERSCRRCLCRSGGGSNCSCGTRGSNCEGMLGEEHICCCSCLHASCDCERAREASGSSGKASCSRSRRQSTSSGNSSSSEGKVDFSRIVAADQPSCSSKSWGTRLWGGDGIRGCFRRDSCSSMSNASSDCWHMSRSSSNSSSSEEDESRMDEGSGAEEDEDAAHDGEVFGSSRRNSDSATARRPRSSGAATRSRSPLHARISIDSRHLRKPSPADIVRSLLTMMSFNVAQQAYLHAVLHGLKRIVLAGFLLDVPGFLASLQHSVRFWSKNECKVYFCSLSAFLGALGACLSHERCSPVPASGSDATCGHALRSSSLSSRNAALRMRSRDMGWQERKNTSSRKAAVHRAGRGSGRGSLEQCSNGRRSRPLSLGFPAADGEEQWTQEPSSGRPTWKREGGFFDEEENEEAEEGEDDGACLMPPFSPSTPTAFVPDGWQQLQQHEHRMDTSPAPHAEEQQQPYRSAAAAPKGQQVLARWNRRYSDAPAPLSQLLPSPFLPPPPPFRPSAASCFTQSASLPEGLTFCRPLERQSGGLQESLLRAQTQTAAEGVDASVCEAGAREEAAAGRPAAARARRAEPHLPQQEELRQQPDRQ